MKNLRKESNFKTKSNNVTVASDALVYDFFNGYESTVSVMLPKSINLALVDDVVKFFSYNYAIADATGVVTEGIRKFLSAKTVEEASKTIKCFGEEGTEAKTGQRYVEYGKLIKRVLVSSKLGGGLMSVAPCSKFEVITFFKRLKSLDVAACNIEDLKAMQADMQVIGRVIQEIAIDMAKDKSLDAGIDLKDTFSGIKVSSRFIKDSETMLNDNVKEISNMVRESISKNKAINTGVEIDSVPDYKMEVKDFSDQEQISDWAFDVQKGFVETQNEFMNEQVMPVIKQAGATKEDLEIHQLSVNYGVVIKEFRQIIGFYNKYVSSLRPATVSKDADDNQRMSKARMSADKSVKEAFRDTVYSIGRSYGLDDALIRKLVYAATMDKGVHSANIKQAIAVAGEADMLLMWSNEEGVVQEAVNVELAEMFEELFDADELDKMEVEFIDDVAYNEFNEEVAYGCGIKALNGKGVIVAETITVEVDGKLVEQKTNNFKFLPERTTEIAPIGNKRVAFLNTFNNAGLMNPFVVNRDAAISEEEANELADNIVMAKNAFFIPQAKTGDQCALGIVGYQINPMTGEVVKDVNGKPVKENKLVGTCVKVGDAYYNDMFIATKEINGVVVPANNKKHVVETAIATRYGILLVLSC